MKYAIQKTEQNFPFFIKEADLKTKTLSVEVDIAQAKHFDTAREAQKYADDNRLVGKSVSIVPYPGK